MQLVDHILAGGCGCGILGRARGLADRQARGPGDERQGEGGGGESVAVHEVLRIVVVTVADGNTSKATGAVKHGSLTNA